LHHIAHSDVPLYQLRLHGCAGLKRAHVYVVRVMGLQQMTQLNRHHGAATGA
jgi:hypothetical protein